MDNSFSSSFGKDEFKKLLAKYEEMASGKQPAYFDADQPRLPNITHLWMITKSHWM